MSKFLGPVYTLGGVVLGVVLSNRYVARQEKAKRNTAIIEEIYLDVYRLNQLVFKNFDDHVLITKGIEKFDRIDALTFLYLPPVVNNQYVEYFTAIYEFSRDLSVIKEDEKSDMATLHKTHPEVINKIIGKLDDLKMSLKSLARSSQW